jgi:hypothetical protein
MSDFCEVRQTTRTTPINACIYCGAQDGLTDEHIVPFALGGNLVLPKASCENCAKITSAFERRVLRGFMLPARTVAGLPSRRPKDRQTSLSMEIEGPNGFESVEVPIAEFPAILHLPTLPPPRFLCGQVEKTGIDLCGLDTIGFGKEPRDVAEAFETTKIRHTQTDYALSDFVRLLAKIGYSFIVSRVGMFTFDEVPVLPLILGRTDDGSHWVGSAQFETASEKAGGLLHALKAEERVANGDLSRRVLVAQIKLFAGSGVTGYEVVVRRWQKT